MFMDVEVKRKNWRNESRKLYIEHELKEFSKAFRDNFFTLIISSFGLLTALTWNDFWREFITTLSAENSLAYKLLIAVFITLLAVVFTYIFSRMKNLATKSQ